MWLWGKNQYCSNFLYSFENMQYVIFTITFWECRRIGAAQWGCIVSILREVQNMTAHDPRHGSSSTSSRKVGPDSFQTLLPTSTVLWTLNSSLEQHVRNTHGDDAWKFGIYFLLIHKAQTDPSVKNLYGTFLHGLYKIASLTQTYWIKNCKNLHDALF